MGLDVDAVAGKWAVAALRLIHIQAYRRFEEYLVAPYLRLAQSKRSCKDIPSKNTLQVVSHASCAMGLGGCYPLSESSRISEGKGQGAVALLSRCAALLGEVLRMGLCDKRLRVVEFLAACVQVKDPTVSCIALRRLNEISWCEVSPSELPNAELFLSHLIDKCATRSESSSKLSSSAGDGKISAEFIAAQALLAHICHSASWRRLIDSMYRKAKGNDYLLYEKILSLRSLMAGFAEA